MHRVHLKSAFSLCLHAPRGDAVHLTTVSIIHGARPRHGLATDSPFLLAELLHISNQQTSIHPRPCTPLCQPQLGLNSLRERPVHVRTRDRAHAHQRRACTNVPALLYSRENCFHRSPQYGTLLTERNFLRESQQKKTNQLEIFSHYLSLPMPSGTAVSGSPSLHPPPPPPIPLLLSSF